VNNILNDINKEVFDKEINRWKNFVNIMNQPKPSVNHTPKQLVWKTNKATLWHYPAVEKKYNVPIFLVYSILNKPYILDLEPGSSVIESLISSGYDVYLIDFGMPGYEDKDKNLEDYIEDYIKKGVQRTLRHSGAQEVTMVGYCAGGMLATIYAAVAEEPIKNLIVACMPVDFSVATVPDKWYEGLKNGSINLDRFIDAYGLVPADFVGTAFKAANPFTFSKYAGLLKRADNQHYVDKWSRMNNWYYDQIPVTGGALRQLLNDFIKENKLMKGEFTLHGKKVDLSSIQANLLVITSKNDDLVLEEQCTPIMDLVSSEDKTLQQADGGHVSFALNGQFAEAISSWLSSRS
jgi:polyhydroxyalkanoate synthase subunit PhaC